MTENTSDRNIGQVDRRLRRHEMTWNDRWQNEFKRRGSFHRFNGPRLIYTDFKKWLHRWVQRIAGEVWVWGDNHACQVGDGTKEPSRQVMTCDIKWCWNIPIYRYYKEEVMKRNLYMYVFFRLIQLWNSHLVIFIVSRGEMCSCATHGCLLRTQSVGPHINHRRS